MPKRRYWAKLELMVAISNEQFAEEVAKYIVGHRKIRVIDEDLKFLAILLDYHGDFNAYIKTAEGKEFLSRKLRVERLKAGWGLPPELKD